LSFYLSRGDATREQIVLQDQLAEESRAAKAVQAAQGQVLSNEVAQFETACFRKINEWRSRHHSNAVRAKAEAEQRLAQALAEKASLVASAEAQLRLLSKIETKVPQI
jgi:hypothetical protein